MNYLVTGVKALKDNYIWHIIHIETNHTIIIDPGEAKPVLNFLANHHLTPSAIFITHHHYDHTDGITDILTSYPIPVYGPESENIANCNVRISDNNSIYLDDFPKFNVLSIPGHTKHHVAYYSPPWLFPGDTLFTGGCGCVFEGTYEQMYNSLLRLKALPEDTLVYCGHEYTLANLNFAKAVEPHNKALLERLAEVTRQRQNNLGTVPATIAIEKLTNPFLRCDQPSIQEAVKHHFKKEIIDEVSIFKHLREWKNQF